jgi:SnoaL-like domain
MSKARTNLERFYAAIDASDYTTASNFLSEDVDWVWGGVPQSGREAVKKFLGGGGGSLADRKHRITAYVENDQQAAAELAVTAAHAGPLHLPTGPIPASGKSLRISVCHFVHIDPGGLFDISHIYVDFVGLLAQISPSARSHS